MAGNQAEAHICVTLNRFRDGRTRAEPRKMVDITRDKPIKVTIRVVVPVRDHPKFNFVGKLLGPKGNSLKRLQEDTMTKMAILGRGSMRDRHKEEELRKSGDPKFSHLLDDLHVEITSFAPPAEAHARIAYALAEVRRFLVPDYNDEIRQEQMWEMHVINSGGKQQGQQLQQQQSGQVATSQSAGDAGALSECSEAPSSAHSSHGSLSPPTQPPVSPPHPALRDITPPGPGTTGRKRPLIPGTRPTMSPTKRTVLSILARARAAQAKELGVTPPYPHITNG
ncbi:KH domain-containing, RNA-binding, signal transduction-associated protein 2-like [Lycorma delicatula]|uniref:KH domain-containing, RNA-binding, signal transduction-associated protein 2-like n=1 Tax=Lycorma delicatula TaxID=130591 RepID=UPI003F513C3C